MGFFVTQKPQHRAIKYENNASPKAIPKQPISTTENRNKANRVVARITINDSVKA